MKRAMSVAILITGLPRSFSNILLPFLEKLPDNFHIFMSIPMYDRGDNGDRFLNQKPDLEKLISCKRIKTILIDSDTTIADKEHTQREKNVIIQWKRLYKLAKLVPSEYDIIIRCRPDIRFLCDAESFLAYFKRSIPENCVLVPSGFDLFDSRFADKSKCINDQFAIGRRDTMMMYCNLYESIVANTATSDPIISEYALASLLRDAGILIQRIDIPYNLVLSECFTFSICGDSGSGKSSLSKLLQEILPFDNTLLFETDRYHKWERGAEEYKTYTHLHPEANHLEKLSTDAYKLRLGEEVYIVDYDHDTGKFTEPQPVQAKNYIIFCGLHTLYQESLRSIMDLRIYLDTDPELKSAWKVERDVRERGAMPEKVLATMKAREPDFKQFIQPQRDNANIIIRKKANGTLEIELCRKSFGLEIPYIRSCLKELVIEIYEKARFAVFVFPATLTPTTDLTSLARKEGYALADLKESHDGIIQYIFILLAWKKPYEPIFV